MSNRTDALTQVLFNKPSLEACSLEQLDYLAHQYPYFSTAQLLLLQKTAPQTDAYAQQLQRTALHFSNPLQLQQWLQPDAFEEGPPTTELFQNLIPIEAEESEIGEEVATPQPTITESETIQSETVEIMPPVFLTEADKAPKVQEHTQPVPQPETIALPEEVPQPESTEEPVLTFEPYHTVDYFASQGIKLSQQETGNDKLGKGLKSFTEWLKTMKRLPEAAAAQQPDTTSERKVENLAAHSLDAADVVTESMAEVWLKQGAKEKAVDVYNKLRLRDPAKSAYFAAKIEALKQ